MTSGDRDDVTVTGPDGTAVFAASGVSVADVLARLRSGDPLVTIAAAVGLTDAEQAYCRDEFTPGLLRLSAAAERAFANGRIAPAPSTRRRPPIAAGHPTDGACDCDEQGDAATGALPCRARADDRVCGCECHVDYAQTAADAVERLAEYVRDLCIAHHNAPYQACARCATVLRESGCD